MVTVLYAAQQYKCVYDGPLYTCMLYTCVIQVNVINVSLITDKHFRSLVTRRICVAGDEVRCYVKYRLSLEHHIDEGFHT